MYSVYFHVIIKMLHVCTKGSESLECTTQSCCIHDRPLVKISSAKMNLFKRNVSSKC